MDYYFDIQNRGVFYVMYVRMCIGMCMLFLALPNTALKNSFPIPGMLPYTAGPHIALFCSTLFYYNINETP